MLGGVYIQHQRFNQSHAFNVRMFYYKVSYQLIIYNYMGEREKLEETIRYAQEGLAEYGDQLSFESKLVIMANLMNAYMGIDNLNRADELWNNLFRKESKDARRDIYDDLYLFRLFNMLHSKSYSVVPALAHSAYRYFRQFEDYDVRFPMEIRIAALLQKEHDYGTLAVKRRLLQEVKDIVTEYLASLKGTNGFQEHFTLYLIWINAIIGNEPFYVAARKWYLEYMEGEGKQRVKNTV